MESLAYSPPAAAAAVLPRSSIVVAALSTVVEWYDFTLYLYVTTVLSRVFFGAGSSSLLATLAVFAVAYLMRPLGAMTFGHAGDRRGRRKVLLASMTVMTAAMLATAALPTRDQIGSAAGALLLLLRCVMGFAVGCPAGTRTPSGFEVTTHGGRRGTGIDAIDWAAAAAELGAGEILLNSMDADGTKDGYDTEMIQAVRRKVTIPVIASGGAGQLDHFAPAVAAGADAVLAASVFHFGELRIPEVKGALRAAGHPVRY